MEQTETRSDLPSSRAEAKRLGYKHYFTGKPCKHGHTDLRYIVDGCCASCSREKAADQAKKNPEKNARKHRQYRRKRPDIVCSVDRRSYHKNKHKYKVRKRLYRLNNLDKARFSGRSYQASKKNAIPGWLTDSDWRRMQQFYRVAKLMEARYNNQYQVDHIVPLQGKTVCGLHCPANLQILPARENVAKGNRWNDEQPS